MPAFVRDPLAASVARKERAAQRAAGGRIGRDIGRALVVGLCLAALFAIGAQFGGRSLFWAPWGSQRDLGEELATGTIVFVPWLGDDCRLRWIDNATWRIFEHGLVECRTALAHSEVRAYGGYAMRVDIIREGFRKR